MRDEPVTRFVVLDIETIRDETLPAPKDPERCAPPPWHEIVCVGWMQLDLSDPSETMCGALLGDLTSDAREASLLQRLVSGFAKDPGRTLVTFSGRRLDVPAIVARCMKHGIPWPWWWRKFGTRVRYKMEGHIDLCDELSEYGAADFVRLDVWASLCGLPSKSGHGSDVAQMYAEGRILDIAAYCLDDVRITAGLLLRWLAIRGEITVDEEAVLRERVLNVQPGPKERKGPVGVAA